GLEVWFGEEALEASDSPELRNYSLHQLFDDSIRAAGGHFNGNRKSDAYIAAIKEANDRLKASAGSALDIKADGFTNVGATSILENVANKTLLASYSAQDVVWPFITRQRGLTDFKVHKSYRLGIHGGYVKVPATGQIQHGTMSDQSYTLSGDTYGMIVSLSREDIINDDLAAFMDIPNQLGRLAALAKEFAVIALLLDWDLATAGRQITPDFGPDGLKSAKSKFRIAKDTDNKPVLARMDRILVGSQDEHEADDLFEGDTFIATGVGSSAELSVAKNRMKGKYRPYVSSCLDDTAITNMEGEAISANQDSNRWYAFANPAILAAIQIGFVQNKRVPTIESSTLQFDMLGMQWRIFDDWGVGQGDPAGVVLSTGTG
ncbi:MAG: hypothetical protein KDA71_23670, partial [Planctomycetales bacterium]|nr:hypothetical protein [Planctomycetales bacterium]